MRLALSFHFSRPHETERSPDSTKSHVANKGKGRDSDQALSPILFQFPGHMEGWVMSHFSSRTQSFGGDRLSGSLHLHTEGTNNWLGVSP